MLFVFLPCFSLLLDLVDFSSMFSVVSHLCVWEFFSCLLVVFNIACFCCLVRVVPTWDMKPYLCLFSCFVLWVKVTAQHSWRRGTELPSQLLSWSSSGLSLLFVFLASAMASPEPAFSLEKSFPRGCGFLW